MEEKKKKPPTLASPNAEDTMEGFVGPDRKKMPDTREGLTNSVKIGGFDLYIVANRLPDGSLGEVFLTFGKDGTTMQGFIDSFAIMLSIGLQFGVELPMLARKFGHMRFEPNGETTNPDIPHCWSIPDYIFKWLAVHFGDDELREDLAKIDRDMADQRRIGRRY